MTAAQRNAELGPLLVELGDCVSLDELERVLATQGLSVMTNHKTKRQRVVRIPALLRVAVVDDVTHQTDRAVGNLPRRDNQIVEPLHHRAHPRSRGVADFSRKRGNKV